MSFSRQNLSRFGCILFNFGLLLFLISLSVLFYWLFIGFYFAFLILILLVILMFSLFTLWLSPNFQSFVKSAFSITSQNSLIDSALNYIIDNYLLIISISLILFGISFIFMFPNRRTPTVKLRMIFTIIFFVLSIGFLILFLIGLIGGAK